MAAGVLEPVTGGFHMITGRTVSDVTETSCEQCDFGERAGSGSMLAVSHAADHAISTGHTVTETRVRVTVVRGCP